MHESTHIMNVGTDIDDLESLVALDLLVDESAIGAGGHTINLNRVVFLSFVISAKIASFFLIDAPILPFTYF